MSINKNVVILLGAAAITGLCKLIYEKGRYDAVHAIYENGMTVVKVEEQNDNEKG